MVAETPVPGTMTPVPGTMTLSEKMEIINKYYEWAAKEQASLEQAPNQAP
jgi:hypothetical protein